MMRHTYIQIYCVYSILSRLHVNISTKYACCVRLNVGSEFFLHHILLHHFILYPPSTRFSTENL